MRIRTGPKFIASHTLLTQVPVVILYDDGLPRSSIQRLSIDDRGNPSLYCITTWDVELDTNAAIVLAARTSSLLVPFLLPQLSLAAFAHISPFSFSTT
jgi:hypothetical protein